MADPCKPSILVVEDDDSMRALLQLHLRAAGYRVTAAEDAAVAGRHILACAPDLVIADIQLPYMSGLEFASILLADTTLPSIPVVLISAHEEYRERAEALGLVFLLKPILRPTLLATVASLLSGDRSRAARQSTGFPASLVEGIAFQ
jgi:DNA-binding response OmpR family regulator